MKVQVTFTDCREPMDFGGIKSVHSHGRNESAILKTDAREFTLENVKCVHVHAKSARGE
jgi:hypothetical protein